MTTLSHSNRWLHDMLTDQGACSHEHQPDSWEDTGDAETGPILEGGPAFDIYTSESHTFIIDATGTVVDSELIEWDMWRFCEEMAKVHNEPPTQRDRDERETERRWGA
jgi:hypothetical protein